jgi:hypothetical protein
MFVYSSRSSCMLLRARVVAFMRLQVGYREFIGVEEVAFGEVA